MNKHTPRNRSQTGARTASPAERDKRLARRRMASASKRINRRAR
jgi:hypothetical protein